MSLFGGTPAQQPAFAFGTNNNTPANNNNSNASIPSFSLSFGNQNNQSNQAQPLQQPQQSGLFGSNTAAPAFGSQPQQQQTQSVFGSPAASSPFQTQGQQPNNSNFGQNSFGQSVSSFGQSVNGFGQSTGGLAHSQSAYDLTSPHQQLQAQQRQQQQGLQSTADFLLSSPSRPPPPTPSWASNGDGQPRRYIPSHITHMRYKNANGTPESRSVTNSSGYLAQGSPNLSGYPQSMSPLGSLPPSRTSTPLTSSPSMSRLRNSKSGLGNQKFGGQSFGVPKPHHSRSSLAQNSISANGTAFSSEVDELPPTDSIYDAGAASPFAFQLPSTTSTSSIPAPSSDVAGPNVSLDDSFMLPQLPSTPGTPSASSQRQSKEEPSSVIVFGFPPELSHVVVEHFSKFGTIMEHLTGVGSANEGLAPVPVVTGKNWVRITYTTPAAANRALSENGRTIGTGDYYIGCVPYTSSSNTSDAARGTPMSTRRIRGSDTSMNIHAMLSGDGADNAANSYASAISRRRKGGDDRTQSSYLFTPQPAAPQQPPQLFSPMQAPEKSMSTPSLSRTTSMPTGLGKRIDLRGPEGIFKEKERKGGMLPGSATLRGLASIFMGGEDQQRGTKRANGEELNANGAKKMQSSQAQSGQGWLGWTTKKAQEFIFGWDDL